MEHHDHGTIRPQLAAGLLTGTITLGGLGYYYLLVTGKLTLDTGIGRRVRPLGPYSVTVAAPAETVFDVIAAPYLAAHAPRDGRQATGARARDRHGPGRALHQHPRRQAHRRDAGNGPREEIIPTLA
jgi:hypothetical protein